MGFVRVRLVFPHPSQVTTLLDLEYSPTYKFPKIEGCGARNRGGKGICDHPWSQIYWDGELGNWGREFVCSQD